MWRFALIALTGGIAAITAIALRNRSSTGVKLASILWTVSGALVVFTVLLGSATSFGAASQNVSREAVWVAPLGGAMVLGGLVLYGKAQSMPSRRPTKGD